MISNLTGLDYQTLLNGDQRTQFKLKNLLESLVKLTEVFEGSGAPTFKADKHTWYLDTATNKYYRNVDGGTTWVALN